jgi:TctA family transporter
MKVITNLLSIIVLLMGLILGTLGDDKVSGTYYVTWAIALHLFGKEEKPQTP